MTTTTAKNTTFRDFYRIKGLSVAYHGNSIKRTYQNKNIFNAPTTHDMAIKTDTNGNKYIDTKDYGRLRVDMLVATCFCYKPTIYHNYIIHKDGNKSNCSKYNLQWATRDEYRNFYKSELSHTDTETGETWVWSCTAFYVSKSGKVRLNGKDCTVYDSLYDPDLATERAISPFVWDEEGKHRVFVEDLVADAFCDVPEGVNGKQHIHHKDYDMYNNSADNLEYVDSDNPEYQKYLEERRKVIEKKNDEFMKQYHPNW